MFFIFIKNNLSVFSIHCPILFPKFCFYGYNWLLLQVPCAVEEVQPRFALPDGQDVDRGVLVEDARDLLLIPLYDGAHQHAVDATVPNDKHGLPLVFPYELFEEGSEALPEVSGAFPPFWRKVEFVLLPHGEQI